MNPYTQVSDPTRHAPVSRKGSPDWTHLAMFLWTNNAPGLEPVTTEAGTLESEQPIHSTYQRHTYTESAKIVSTDPQRHYSETQKPAPRLTLGDCPSADFLKKSGSTSRTALAHSSLACNRFSMGLVVRGHVGLIAMDQRRYEIAQNGQRVEFELRHLNTTRVNGVNRKSRSYRIRVLEERAATVVISASSLIS